MINVFLERRWLQHVLFWLVLVTPFVVLLGGDPNYTYWQAFRDVMLQALAYAVLVYINLLVLVPQFLQQRRFGAYLGLLLVCLALTVPLHALAEYFSYQRTPLREAGNLNYWLLLLMSAINMMVMIALTSGLKFAKKWFVHQRETQVLEREKLQAELKFLKAQINPHFLFNTLNNLYSLTLKKSDQAPDMVLKLSEMMRYMLYHSNERIVPLEKEITYMRNYIDLEQMRKLDKAEVSFEVDDDYEGKMIAPLLLIPFLENSFKHGISHNTSPGWVRVKMQIDDNRLNFVIENSKPKNGHKHINGTDHGVGLKNVKRRLDLLYPDNYTLKIEDTPDHYKTELKLNLQ